MDKFKRVLLVGSFSKETFQIESRLKELGGDVEVHLCTDFDEIPKLLQSYNFGLMVCNLGQLNERKLDMVNYAREIGFREPVLVLAKVLSQDLARRVQDMLAVILLEKPFENKDLQGISMKFLSAIDVNQRTHRRYYTNQQAEVELFGHGGGVHSRVFNMSKGGAYFESTDISACKIGDEVSMRIRLHEVAREYQVVGKIVWTTEQGIWTGGYGVGVEFLHADELNKTLVFKAT